MDEQAGRARVSRFWKSRPAITTKGETMSKWAGLAAAVAVCGLVGLSAGAYPDASIHDVMEQAHKPTKGLRALIGTEVAKPKPDWTEVQKMSKEYVMLAAALGKNDPPKGDKLSWKKMTSGFESAVKALDVAAGKKDANGVKAASKKIGDACMPCHKLHRED
jgi:cytochrome c556